MYISISLFKDIGMLYAREWYSVLDHVALLVPTIVKTYIVKKLNTHMIYIRTYENTDIDITSFVLTMWNVIL
jgi:hypothetical protein